MDAKKKKVTRAALNVRRKCAPLSVIGRDAPRSIYSPAKLRCSRLATPPNIH